MPTIYRLLGIASLLANGAVLSTRDRVTSPPPVAAAAVASRDYRVAGLGTRVGTPAASSRRGDDGLFHLTGRHASRAVDFVVDTGASVTVLTAADAKRLAIETTGGDDRAVLATAGGQVAMAWARLPALTVGGRTIAAIDVAVVERGIGRSLLGQDVLAQLGTIVIAGDELNILPDE